MSGPNSMRSADQPNVRRSEIAYPRMPSTPVPLNPWDYNLKILTSNYFRTRGELNDVCNACRLVPRETTEGDVVEELKTCSIRP